MPFMWLPGLPVPLEPMATDYYETSARIEILHTAEEYKAGHQGLWLYAAPGSGVWWDPGRRLVKKNSIDAVVHFNSLEEVVARYKQIETNLVSPAASHVKRWKLALGNHSWEYTVQMAANGTECFGLLAMVTQFLVHLKPLTSGLSGTQQGSWATEMRTGLQKEGIDSLIMTAQSHYWPRHEAARSQFHNAGDLVAQCRAGVRHPLLRKVPEIIDFRHVGPGAESLLRKSAAASADGSQPCAIAATAMSCTSCTHAGHVLCECDASKQKASEKHRCCLDGGDQHNKSSSPAHRVQTAQHQQNVTDAKL